ncbi:MAG: addiction module protein [Nitrospirales bacterium]
MTLHEKLALMELLWEDLARTPETVESPVWHKTTLDERQQRLKEGKSRFSDWETAKANIRHKLSPSRYSMKPKRI